MTVRKNASTLLAFSVAGSLAVGCFGGGSFERPLTPTPTTQSTVQASPPTVTATASATPFPSVAPALPLLTSYVVQSGDYPLLIAEKAGVPPGNRDAWIAEMLALNNVEATALQVGQELLLPPPGEGATAGPTESPPLAGVVEPAVPIDTQTPSPQPSATGTPGPGSGAPPFAPTPPFVAFITPTTTTSATPPPTASPAQRAWITSSEDGYLHYYCDLDSGWRDIPAEDLVVFDSEQQLLAVWGRFRTRAPDTVC